MHIDINYCEFRSDEVFASTSSNKQEILAIFKGHPSSSDRSLHLMDRKSKSYMNEEDDMEENMIAESPPSSTMLFNIDGLASSSTNKRSRRATQKRVVQIPIKETEGPRLKGESNTPPSDSWAWRKYGQKPIKGSPYPRGYYRCSSSKGCPARKQVERSRVDPTMLVVTYSSDHNHPWPLSRNHNHSSARTPKKSQPEDKLPDPVHPDSHSHQDKFADLAGAGADESIMPPDDHLGWFGEMAPTSSLRRTSLFSAYDAEVAASVLLPMAEEEESLFADLGELPECSVVFRRGLIETAEQRRRYATPWCGTTS